MRTNEQNYAAWHTVGSPISRPGAIDSTFPKCHNWRKRRNSDCDNNALSAEHSLAGSRGWISSVASRMGRPSALCAAVPESKFTLDGESMTPPVTRRSPAHVSLAAEEQPQARTLIALAVVAVLFILLLFSVMSTPFSPIELQITRSIQAFHPGWFDWLMRVTSDFGFYPEVVVWVATIIVALWIGGYRWESIGVLFAAAGNAALETIVKREIPRPRPDPGLVHVLRNLDGLKESFPAGHVMANVAIMGFLIYLLYTFAKPSWLRTLAIAFLSSQIILIGLSRIYEGEHWFTDVVGGYLLGLLLLEATFYFYQLGRARFSHARPAQREDR